MASAIAHLVAANEDAVRDDIHAFAELRSKRLSCGAQRRMIVGAGWAAFERTRATNPGMNATSAPMIEITDALVISTVRRQGLEPRTR
jgi:hypothetical protein